MAQALKHQVNTNTNKNSIEYLAVEKMLCSKGTHPLHNHLSLTISSAQYPSQVYRKQKQYLAIKMEEKLFLLQSL